MDLELELELEDMVTLMDLLDLDGKSSSTPSFTGLQGVVVAERLLVVTVRESMADRLLS